MKILLIYPTVTPKRTDATPPIKAFLIGLAYIGGMLKNKGYDVRIIDCLANSQSQISDSQIEASIFWWKPDVVGISCMFTPYAKDAHRIAGIAKKHKSLVVFGGSHASTFPEEVMKDPNVDLVVVGEGEHTICDVLERYKVSKDFSGINGIVHRKDGVVVTEPPRNLIENLDDLPYPAWELMENDLKTLKEETSRNKFIMRKPAIHLITSRGCPRDCYFCSVKLIWGKTWRARSAYDVVDEIELLIKKGYNEFYFMDDNCSVSKERMHDICDLIIKRELKIRIATPTGIAINTLDKSLLRKMKQAGFYRLCFGIETANPESQKIIKKRVNLKQARNLIKIANRLGFWTSATFIVGFPHETKKELQKTLNFVLKTGMDFPVFHLLNPQPKTEVYEIMKKDGLITDDNELDVTYGNGFKTHLFTNKDLHRIVAKLYRKFLILKFISPRTYLNLLLKIKSKEDLKYALGLAKIPIDMLLSSLKGKKLSVISIREKDKELAE